MPRTTHVLGFRPLLTFLAPALGLVALGTSTPALADEPDLAAETGEPTPQISNGITAQNCQFPTTLTMGGCTATLVHPRLATTASHCFGGAGPSSLRFGESNGLPQRTVGVDFCMRHPVYDESNGQNLDHDAAFCVLSEAVTDVPITPVLFSCGIRELYYEQDQVVFAGFGQGGNAGGGGIKRYDETQVSSDVTDFRNSILLGGPGNSACPGDSGGPAYIRMPDGTWHNFGITSFGTAAGCGGTPTSYVMPHAFLPWIEEESGIDITPCGDADGNWAPTEECTGFSMDPLDSSGSWETGCQHQLSGPLRTCGPAYDEEPDTLGPAVALINPEDQAFYDTDLAEFTVQIDASDEWGVREVRMLINGEDAGVSVTRGEYAFDAAFPTGTYSLQATATDWSGNGGLEAPYRKSPAIGHFPTCASMARTWCRMPVAVRTARRWCVCC